ncbi:MAG: hypothetical protein AAF562_06680 [Pseudomonadota bacterium]
MTEEAVTAPAEPTVIEAAPAVEVPETPSEPTPEAPTRMDSIQKAFDSLDEVEPLADASQEASSERPRGPDGKFIAKNGNEQEKPQEIAAKLEDQPSIMDAPSRFSADAKAAWAEAPDAVKGEIHRAVRELESGLQQKDAQLAPLKPFFEMAEQHNTDVQTALGNYVRMEQLLAKDMKAGFEALAQNFGMTVEDMVAKATGGQSTSPDKDRHIATLTATVQQLQQQVSGVQQTQKTAQETQIMQQINAFAADKPAFDLLENDIAALLTQNEGMTLEQAYEEALANAQKLMTVLSPQPNPAPTPQQRPARSVTGAPTSTGSNPAARKPSANRGEAISRAFDAAGF